MIINLNPVLHYIITYITHSVATTYSIGPITINMCTSFSNEIWICPLFQETPGYFTVASVKGCKFFQYSSFFGGLAGKGEKNDK
ncbi:MAG: hypothetical protein QGH91_03935 [Candidatus Marinimicrobia bacterium]|nr:hypothetical protein [Candidatus Neomarinimicrobiota bacterium]